jgi:DNA-binding Xre family transcriptional regulator
MSITNRKAIDILLYKAYYNSISITKEGVTMRIDRIKLAALLAREDMTVKALAERSGLNYVTVSQIKSGRKCRDETGLKIAEALNVKPEALLETVDR